MALAGLALLASSCRETATEDRATKAEAGASDQAAEVPTPLPVATPLAPIARSGLVAAFALASDATAAGRPLPDANRDLVGRTFSLKLPFGCSGEAIAGEPAWAGWTYDSSRRALKLTATPQRWTDAAWVKSIAGTMAHEAVEGFWLDRPWTSSEDCPTGSAPLVDADSSAPAERQTVGIAQFFAPDSPRTFQRGSRPYSHTVRVREPAEINGRTYRLALSGRITGFPDGQPIRCIQEAPDLRPLCLMAVEFARVSFEDPRDDTVLAEWRN